MSKKYKKATERESIIKGESYIQVFGWMASELKLKGNTLMVYAIIHGFTNSKDERIDMFNGSLRYLADWTNSSKQGILDALEKLLKLDYIEKNPIEVNGVKYVEYRSRMLYDEASGLVHRSQKTWIENVKYVDRDIQTSGHNNIVNNQESNLEVKKEDTKVPEVVSPKTEDTPSSSEIEEMKKQLQELQMQLKEQIEEKKQKQGQNLVEKIDKTKPFPLGTKDDKVKGEKEEGQEPTDVTDTFEYNEEGLNAVFGGFEFKQPTESSREEEKEADIYKDVEDWFLN